MSNMSQWSHNKRYVVFLRETVTQRTLLKVLNRKKPEYVT